MGKQILLGVLVADKGDEVWMEAVEPFAFLDNVLGRERWVLAYGSAEKHPDIFKTYCKMFREHGVKVVIATAGLLPMIGRVAAAEFWGGGDTTVICVPQTESGVVPILWSPAGVALTCSGWGKRGFFNGCIDACKRLVAYDSAILPRLGNNVLALLDSKKPEFDVRKTLELP